MSAAETSRQVLVVEDDADTREAIAEMLDGEGYAVVQAANGQEALELLSHGDAHPCLILVEWRMPVMGGEKFVHELDACHPPPGCHVVAITADDYCTSLPHVLKPFGIDTVLAVLHDTCAT